MSGRAIQPWWRTWTHTHAHTHGDTDSIGWPSPLKNMKRFAHWGRSPPTLPSLSAPFSRWASEGRPGRRARPSARLAQRRGRPPFPTFSFPSRIRRLLIISYLGFRPGSDCGVCYLHRRPFSLCWAQSYVQFKSAYFTEQKHQRKWDLPRTNAHLFPLIVV